MRILICDDDLLILNQLKEYIEAYFKQNKLKCPEIVIYNNGEDLLSDEQDKDIVFLDIEMPGLNGIFVGNELKKSNENVIIFIVTSYSEYLVMQCVFTSFVIFPNLWINKGYTGM